MIAPDSIAVSVNRDARGWFTGEHALQGDRVWIGRNATSDAPERIEIALTGRRRSANEARALAKALIAAADQLDAQGGGS